MGGALGTQEEAAAGAAVKAEMKNLRWPALLLIPLILAGLIFFELSDDDDSSTENPPVSSLVWYCPVLNQDGMLGLANSTDTDGTARLTFFSSLFDSAINEDESLPYLADAREVAVPALSSVEVNVLDFLRTSVQTLQPEDTSRVSRLTENEAVFVSVLVEFSSPGFVAESKFCITQASTSWYIPFASTSRDACYYLAVFNPFTAPAVVDVDFGTDEGVQTAYEGQVIPPGSLAVLNVGSKVTRRSHISTALTTRSGRVVTGKYQTFTGRPDGLARTCPSTPYEFEATDEPRLWGSQIVVGAPAGSRQWFFPDGVSISAPGSYIVYNPDRENAAEVEMSFTPNFGSEISRSLTVPPGQRLSVQIREGELHPLPVFPAPVMAPRFESAGIGHWALFESQTEIVVEKLQTRARVREGVAGELGKTVAATTFPIHAIDLNFGGDSGLAFYGIVNPLRNTIARVEIPGITSGAMEVAPGRTFRLAIPRERLQGNEVLTSTTPVVADDFS